MYLKLCNINPIYNLIFMLTLSLYQIDKNIIKYHFFIIKILFNRQILKMYSLILLLRYLSYGVIVIFDRNNSCSKTKVKPLHEF